MCDLLTIVTAIAIVESGGDPLAVGDAGDAIGILQIHREVITDVNRVYKTTYVWPDSARDPVASREIARLYLSYWGDYYAKKHNVPLTPRIYAACWNGGGPHGPDKHKVKPYVERVLRTLKEVEQSTKSEN